MELELFVHGDNAVVQIYTVPGQPQRLTLPQAQE